MCKGGRRVAFSSTSMCDRDVLLSLHVPNSRAHTDASFHCARCSSKVRRVGLDIRLRHVAFIVRIYVFKILVIFYNRKYVFYLLFCLFVNIRLIMGAIVN